MKFTITGTLNLPSLFIKGCSCNPSMTSCILRRRLRPLDSHWGHFWVRPLCWFSFFSFNGNVVDLQCYVNFCHTAKWFGYTYIYILSHILFHYGLSQDTEYSSLGSTVGLLFFHSKCSSLHLLIPDSQSILLPPPPPGLGNRVSMSLCLFLFHRFICVLF